MDPVTTPLTAFIAGVVTSVHCAAMCGPLGCTLLAGGGRKETWVATALYHATRISSYTLVGGVLGWFGLSVAAVFDHGPARWLPWAFALCFLAFGLGAEKWLPPPRFLSRFMLRIRLKSISLSRRAMLLGVFTPFLPCGPLYLVFAVALFSGSFIGGALLMASFGLGTLPLYWLLQGGIFKLQNRFSMTNLTLVRRGLSLVAAVVLCIRALAVSNAGSVLLNGVLCH